jgi:hypothetical protein
MLGSSVTGGWRVGWVKRTRHEGVHAAVCWVCWDELAVSLDTDEFPVRIWIAGISSHVLLGSVRWTPALPVGGPEDRVRRLNVFGCLEGIVAVGSEVFGEIDRQFAESVAVVFDALCECVVVAGLTVSAGVANGDGVIVVEVVSCPASELAVVDVGLDYRVKRLWLDVAIDENSHVNVDVAAFVGFEDSKTFVTSSVKNPI